MYIVSIIDAGGDLPELSEIPESLELPGLSGKYLSMGGLEKGLILNGAERDGNNVCVIDHHIRFPKGFILTVVFKDSKGIERFMDISEEEVCSLVREIEKGRCYKNCKEIKKHKKEIEKAYQGVEVFIVYLTDAGEFLTIHLHTAGAGWHEFEVLSDKDNDEKLIFYQKECVQRVEMFSQDLCEIMSRYVF